MAKHRTRQQKAKTQLGRGRVKAPEGVIANEVQIVRPTSFTATSSTTVKALGTDKVQSLPQLNQSLLRVDRSFLEQDLKKSVLVSIILLMVLIGIFWLVRYNGWTTLQSQLYSITQQ